jgi:hypothetical protein
MSICYEATTKNPPLSIRRINERKKNKDLTVNRYMAMGPAGHNASCEGAGLLPAVSFCFCDEKRSLKSETVKYGHKSQATWTGEILCW